MRRPIIALAAAACLATAACTTDDTAQSPPTDEVTTAATTDAAPATETPEVTAEVTETPKGPPTETGSEDGGMTSEDIDLADHTFVITPQQAIDTATQEAGGGLVHSLELDWSQRHSAWVYELDVLVGNVDHDIDIHADTGEILEHERDDTDDQEQAIDLGSPMTWETARDKALGAVSGRITSWKLEWDDGRAGYQFDIMASTDDDIEVEVDAETGAVRIDD